jgi:hypothetical protein
MVPLGLTELRQNVRRDVLRIILRQMNTKGLIFVAAIIIPVFISQRSDEDRLVHYLEARGYSDVQIEHPDQWHCYRAATYSYRARSPNGTPAHGGACVTLGFFIMTTEPIGEKYFPRGWMVPLGLTEFQQA